MQCPRARAAGGELVRFNGGGFTLSCLCLAFAQIGAQLLGQPCGAGIGRRWRGGRGLGVAHRTGLAGDGAGKQASRLDYFGVARHRPRLPCGDYSAGAPVAAVAQW